LAEPPKIVLGLGNPGSKYWGTRHNLGFRVVERLAALARSSFREGGLAWTAGDARRRVVLAKPRTFMNRSGQAARALLAAHGAAASDLLVVYDDADLELGRLRLRPRGGSGGHNGIRSLADELGATDFARLRLGVKGEKRGDIELADYVLGPFETEEEIAAERLVRRAAAAALAVLDEGLEAAMNRYNR